MVDVFLSYNREDQAVARRYADALTRAGLSVWWDVTLRSGEAYDEVTERALRTAAAVLVLWSPRSVVSRWVRAEATIAARLGTLVPVTIEACERPIMFELTQTANMTGWNGTDTAPAFAALVADLRNFVGKDATTVAAPPIAVTATAAAISPVLAVLPFDNLSGDAEMTYFSDGVSEEILHTIARAKGLRVIGKASSFHFRGRDKTVRLIGDELGATHMLDGSVRRAGNAIRITAQLVETALQMMLWTERYDRALTDIFALQDEIAAAIAAALDAHFTPARVATPIDPDAYDLYLQARAVFGQDNGLVDQLRCIALLERAVARAPAFAMAWGLLAMFRALTLPRTGDGDAPETRSATRTAAGRAVAIDPDCGPAMMALALLKPAFSDYGEKRRLSEAAFRLTPGDSTVAASYATALANTGHLHAACAILDGVVANEPLAPSFAATRAWFYRSAGQNAVAARLASEIAAEFPGSDYAMAVAGLIALYNGNVAQAQAIVAAAEPGHLAILRSTLAFHETAAQLTGAARADWVRQRLAEPHPVTYIVTLGLAAHVGEPELALDHLLAAIDAGRPIAYNADDEGRGVARANLSAALFGVPTEALRRNPRFAQVCVRLGLYDYWLQTGEWPDCVADVAPWYDLRAQCAAVASR
jgi:TolB-like protein